MKKCKLMTFPLLLLLMCMLSCQKDNSSESLSGYGKSTDDLEQHHTFGNLENALDDADALLAEGRYPCIRIVRYDLSSYNNPFSSGEEKTIYRVFYSPLCPDGTCGCYNVSSN